MLTTELLKKAETITFWQELCPELTISDDLFETDYGSAYEVDTTLSSTCAAQYGEEGYFQAPDIIDRADASILANAIRKVTERGFPAQFCLIYDDFWKPLFRLNNLLNPIMGEGYKLLPDFWFYCINNDDSDAGWSPHRDLQFPNPVDKDGRPNVLNLWIPLTDATPLNGCMYMLPGTRDEIYPKDFSSLLELDLTGKPDMSVSSLQNYRALPATAGSVLGWNQFVFHWGSRSSKWAPEPRINYSMYVQRGDIGLYDDLAINIRGKNNYIMNFEMRIGIISRSLWQYQESKNLNMSDSLIEFAKINHRYLNGRGYQELNISRKDPCWCGSGIRYKQCHGSYS